VKKVMMEKKDEQARGRMVVLKNIEKREKQSDEKQVRK